MCEQELKKPQSSRQSESSLIEGPGCLRVCTAREVNEQAEHCGEGVETGLRSRQEGVAVAWWAWVYAPLPEFHP